MILEKDSAAQVLLGMRQNRSSTPPEEHSEAISVGPVSSRYTGHIVQPDSTGSIYDHQMKRSPNSHSSGGDDGHPAYKRRTRKNTTRACTNCRKARQGCDDGRPCKRCVVYGKSHTCEDAEHKSRGRPRSEVSSRHHPYFESSSNNGEKHVLTCRSPVDSAVLHAICTTLEFTCASTTPSIRALLGFYPQEIQGRAFREFVHNEDLELFTRLSAALRQTRLSKPDSYSTANCLEIQKRGETVFSGLASSTPTTTETLRLLHADGSYILSTIKVIWSGPGNGHLVDCIVIQLIKRDYVSLIKSPQPIQALPAESCTKSKSSIAFYKSPQFSTSPNQERARPPHPFFDPSPRTSISAGSFPTQLPPLTPHFPDYPRRNSSFVQSQVPNSSWSSDHRPSDCSSIGQRSSVSTTITIPDSRPGSVSFAKNTAPSYGPLPRNSSVFLNWNPLSRKNSVSQYPPRGPQDSISLPPLNESKDALCENTISPSSKDILPPITLNPPSAQESFIRKCPPSPKESRQSIALPPINIGPR